MRTLKFIVNDQRIEQDPNCDFSGLVPGTEEYLIAEFRFSKEWNGYTKVATFRSMLGKEHPPQLLKDGRTCVIPAEALKKRKFEIGVVGRRNKQKLLTHTVTVCQNGGNE